MIRKNLALAAILALLGCAVAAPVAAEEASAPKPSVRVEVGKPVQAALELLKSKQGQEALAKLKEAEAVAARTPFETYVIDRIKGQALAMSGDVLASAQAFEAAAGSSVAPLADKLPLLAAAIGQYYTAKDYRKAAAVAALYEQTGGKDEGVHSLRVRSLFLAGDYPATLALVGAEVSAIEAAGKTPAEEQYKILAESAQRAGDEARYLAVLKKLAHTYPNKAYWPVLVQSLSHKSGMNTASDRLYLDYLRLQGAVGTLKQAAAYEAAAQIALQQGYPLEAKSFLDQGYEAKLLGQGADAARLRKLRDAVAKGVAEDSKLLGSDDAKLANAKDGNPLFNGGFNYVLHGQADKGLAMMEAGLKKGGVRQPEDAKLRLGYAYHLAGKPAQAIAAFRAVPAANEGASALAELWILFLSSAR